jgi:hypothetical protein
MRVTRRRGPLPASSPAARVTSTLKTQISRAPAQHRLRLNRPRTEGPRMATQEPKTIAFVLYPGITLLDMVGPLQVFSLLQGFNDQHRPVVVAERIQPTPTDTPLTVTADKTFDEAPDPTVVSCPRRWPRNDQGHAPAARRQRAGGWQQRHAGARGGAAAGVPLERANPASAVRRDPAGRRLCQACRIRAERRHHPQPRGPSGSQISAAPGGCGAAAGRVGYAASRTERRKGRRMAAKFVLNRDPRASTTSTWWHPTGR